MGFVKIATEDGSFLNLKKIRRKWTESKTKPHGVFRAVCVAALSNSSPSGQSPN
jgi:hypothetical protein